MKNKQGFKDWLDSYPSLSEYSKRRYANAIDYLSDKYSVNLYDISDMEDITAILSDPGFISFNKVQNRMYSSALGHFVKYILIYNEKEDEIKTEILKEKLKYEQNQKKIVSRKITKSDITDEPATKPEYYKVNGRKVWKRNSVHAAEAILLADYLCEVDNKHKHFISKTTNENYVEAHHLIPIRLQDKFNNSLDVHANIVSVCVACHKQIHHGFFEEKKHILKHLFNNRKERLGDCGIKIGLDDFYSYYKD